MPRKAPLAARAELDPKALAREARLFGRYLVGEDPPREFIDRYVAAHEARWEDLQIPSPAMSAAVRRPGLIPWLDAACGLTQPDDPIRRKLLLMTAVLECSPRYVDRFLPQRKSIPLLMAELAWLGLRSALRAAGGLAIYCWILRRARE